MGEIKTEITLVNIREAGKAQDGIIPESEVGWPTVEAVQRDQECQRQQGPGKLITRTLWRALPGE
jgi:hypothetical protein